MTIDGRLLCLRDPLMLKMQIFISTIIIFSTIITLMPFVLNQIEDKRDRLIFAVATCSKLLAQITAFKLVPLNINNNHKSFIKIRNFLRIIQLTLYIYQIIITILCQQLNATIIISESFGRLIVSVLLIQYELLTHMKLLKIGILSLNQLFIAYIQTKKLRQAYMSALVIPCLSYLLIFIHQSRNSPYIEKNILTTVKTNIQNYFDRINTLLFTLQSEKLTVTNSVVVTILIARSVKYNDIAQFINIIEVLQSRFNQQIVKCDFEHMQLISNAVSSSIQLHFHNAVQIAAVAQSMSKLLNLTISCGISIGECRCHHVTIDRTYFSVWSGDALNRSYAIAEARFSGVSFDIQRFSSGNEQQFMATGIRKPLYTFTRSFIIDNGYVQFMACSIDHFQSTLKQFARNEMEPLDKQTKKRIQYQINDKTSSAHQSEEETQQFDENQINKIGNESSALSKNMSNLLHSTITTMEDQFQQKPENESNQYELTSDFEKSTIITHLQHIQQKKYISQQFTTIFRTFHLSKQLKNIFSNNIGLNQHYILKPQHIWARIIPILSLLILVNHNNIIIRHSAMNNFELYSYFGIIIFSKFKQFSYSVLLVTTCLQLIVTIPNVIFFFKQKNQTNQLRDHIIKSLTHLDHTIRHIHRSIIIVQFVIITIHVDMYVHMLIQPDNSEQLEEYIRAALLGAASHIIANLMFLYDPIIVHPLQLSWNYITFTLLFILFIFRIWIENAQLAIFMFLHSLHHLPWSISMFHIYVTNLHTKINIRDDIDAQSKKMERYRTRLEIKGELINIVLKHPEIQQQIVGQLQTENVECQPISSLIMSPKLNEDEKLLTLVLSEKQCFKRTIAFLKCRVALLIEIEPEKFSDQLLKDVGILTRNLINADVAQISESQIIIQSVPSCFEEDCVSQIIQISIQQLLSLIRTNPSLRIKMAIGELLGASLTKESNSYGIFGQPLDDIHTQIDCKAGTIIVKQEHFKKYLDFVIQECIKNGYRIRREYGHHGRSVTISE